MIGYPLLRLNKSAAWRITMATNGSTRKRVRIFLRVVYARWRRLLYPNCTHPTVRRWRVADSMEHSRTAYMCMRCANVVHVVNGKRVAAFEAERIVQRLQLNGAGDWEWQ